MEWDARGRYVTREEYESQKRRLEAERRAGIELLDAALAAQRRALELIWLTTGEGAVAPAALPGEGGFSSRDASPLASQDASSLVSRDARTSPTPPASPPPDGGPRPVAPAPASPIAAAGKLRSQQIWRDLWKVWPGLPEEFDTADLTHALGYVPHRGALHRLLEQVQEMGELEVVSQGAGRKSSRFRKLAPPAKPAAASAGSADAAPAAPAMDEGGTSPAPAGEAV